MLLFCAANAIKPRDDLPRLEREIDFLFCFADRLSSAINASIAMGVVPATGNRQLATGGKSASH